MARFHPARPFLALSLIAGVFATGWPEAQAQAQEGDGAAQVDPCVARSAEGEMWDSDTAMWECRHEQLDRSEADLTAVIRELTGNYQDDPERLDALKEAHDTWLRFRDAECKLLTIDSASGTMFDLYWTACLTEQNAQRTMQMRKLADNP